MRERTRGYHQRPHERTSRQGKKFVAGRARYEDLQKEWGVTENLYDAGFILRDGTLVDMSQGGGMGRVADHRGVYGYGTAGMMKFMKDYGAIRFSMHYQHSLGHADSASADMIDQPTNDQLDVLYRVSRMVPEMYLERSDRWGNSLANSAPGEGIDDFVRRAWSRGRRQREYNELPSGQAVLYHVTDMRSVSNIKKEGITPGMPPSECKWRFEEDPDEVDQDDEEITREIFNEYLEDNRPDKSLPHHNDSVFFWTDRMKARAALAHFKRYSGGEGVILAVRPDRIPCTLYEASNSIAERLFDYIQSSLRDFSMIQSCGPETKEDEDLDHAAVGFAKDYYASMRPYTGKPGFDKEILCSCTVPPSAVVEVIPL